MSIYCKTRHNWPTVSTVKQLTLHFHCVTFSSLFFFDLFQERSYYCFPSFTSRYRIKILIVYESLSITWQGAVDAFKLVSSFYCGRNQTWQKCVWFFCLWGTLFFIKAQPIRSWWCGGRYNPLREASNERVMIWENRLGAHLPLNRCAATNIQLWCWK